MGFRRVLFRSGYRGGAKVIAIPDMKLIEGDVLKYVYKVCSNMEQVIDVIELERQI